MSRLHFEEARTEEQFAALSLIHALGWRTTYAGAIPADTTSDPVADKLAYSADTIEDLASQMGVPADELTATVDQWNECCANGKDVYFHRPEKTLTPISTPPFYAQLCCPSFLNTDGGPVRSAQGEILDPDGKPIPNLYSAGEFGSVWSLSLIHISEPTRPY